MAQQNPVVETGAVFDVGAVVDGLPIGRFLVGIILLCMTTLIVDGYDVMVVGFIAPAISASFGVSGPALTPVFVSGQVGLAIGAFAAGPLADRFGRRRVILASTLWFACCAAGTVFAGSISQLAAARVITGIGLGGILPNAISLIGEFSPKRIRATLIMVMFSGFSIGSAVAGFVAARLIGPYGWQGPVVVGAVAPLLLLPLLYFTLPESVRLLALRPGQGAEVGRLLRRLDPRRAVVPDARYVSGETPVRARPASLFESRRAWMTVFLWLTFFTNLLDLNLLAAWLPTYLRTFADITPQRAAGVAAFYQIGGTVSVIILGLSIDRFGASRVIALGYLLAAVAIASIGIVDRDETTLTLVLFAAGFFVVGGQTGINAYAGILYPTAIRSTGVAWAFGIGRFGAMLGPALGGLMLAQKLAAGPTFLLAALPIATAAVFVMLVGRNRAG